MSQTTEIIKIAITGGPSGGKTTLIDALSKDFRGQVSVVPEAASILYRGGFPRRNHILGKIHTQRAICHVQRELEDLTTDEIQNDLLNKKNGASFVRQIMVCDRGSLDSIAYWPKDAEDFFRNMKTDRTTELQRYQWVIHLDTADQDSFDTTNPVRLESYIEAIQLNEKIKAAWAHHPQRLVIGHSQDFLQKIAKARKVIELILQGTSYEKLLSQINSSLF